MVVELLGGDSRPFTTQPLDLLLGKGCKAWTNPASPHPLTQGLEQRPGGREEVGGGGGVRRRNQGDSSKWGEAARAGRRAGAASIGLPVASELPGPYHLQCPVFFPPLLLVWDEIIISVLRECPKRRSQDVCV